MCYLQLIIKLGVPLLGQVASYSLFLSWGSRCWDRFAIYSVAKLWVPAGTRANHSAIGRIASCQHWGGGGGGIVGHVRRHFRILFVDSRFLEREGGGGVLSPYPSSGMKMALKNWTGMDSFPIHRLT